MSSLTLKFLLFLIVLLLALYIFSVKFLTEILSCHPIRSKQKKSFTNLPREIHDRIYGYALCQPATNFPAICASRPISIIHADRYTVGQHLKPVSTFYCYEAKDRALGLLFTSRTVSRDAARFLYSKTSFAFINSRLDDWSTLYRFLLTIGAKNRSQIRNLLIVHRESRWLWQRAGCAHTEFPRWSWPRSEHHDAEFMLEHYPLQRLLVPLQEDCDKDLRPCIRTCMQILGRLGPQIRLMIVGQHGWGLASDPYLPRMVERYSQEETLGRVQVLWVGTWNRSPFEGRKRYLEEAGWEVVEHESTVTGRDLHEVTFKARWVG